MKGLLDALSDLIWRFDMECGGTSGVVDDLSQPPVMASGSPSLMERALFRLTLLLGPLLKVSALAYTSRIVSFIERNIDPVDWALENVDGVVRYPSVTPKQRDRRVNIMVRREIEGLCDALFRTRDPAFLSSCKSSSEVLVNTVRWCCTGQVDEVLTPRRDLIC